jgi:hypothetical protein
MRFERPRTVEQTLDALDGLPDNVGIMLDWKKRITTVAATDYGKTVCLESFTRDNAPVAVAAAIWRALAASQDDLGRPGLAHLRSAIPAAA